MSKETTGTLLSQTNRLSSYLCGADQAFSFIISKFNEQNTVMQLCQPDNTISLYFITDGEGQLCLNNTPFTVKSNLGLILYENSTLTSNTPVRYSGFILSFSPEAFLAAGYAYNREESEVLLKMLRNASHSVFEAKQSVRFCFQDLYFTARTSSAIGNTMARNRFFTAITELLYYANLESESDACSMEQAALYIRHNLSKKLSLKELAAQAMMSEARFKREFVQYAGCSPHDYVLLQKIESAKQMLTASDTSIQTICTELAFSSTQYFSTVFKRFVGVSPLKYKKDAQKRV